MCGACHDYPYNVNDDLLTLVKIEEEEVVACVRCNDVLSF